MTSINADRGGEDCFITSEALKFNCSFIVKLNAIHVLLL
jgi:hypothetical protein